MNNNQITYFACDNGDASLIEAHGWTIMTDVNYREAATDADDKTVIDFAPKIRKACSEDSLSIFVLTHPDEDHLRGFGDIFHLGKPESRDNDPDEGDVKIIVDEIWCSPYAINPNYTTDESKPVLDEIARRNKLQGSEEGKKDGNRLRILSVTNAITEQLTSGLEWRLLAPTKDEANIPKAKKGSSENSSNSSSLVIQWTITTGGSKSKILLGGDSTVEIWERINNEYKDDQISWHVLLAPHHCSRHSMGRKEIKDGKEIFVWSEDAIAGLNHPASSRAHIVSSSRKFGSEHPPHPEARQQYYKMLAQIGEVNSNVRERFKITAGENGKPAEDIVFRFTSNGPTLAAIIGSVGVTYSSATQGGGYGVE